MTNTEIEQVMSKMVSVTELLAEDVADLMIGELGRDNPEALSGRAGHIRGAAHELRMAFDQLSVEIAVKR